MAQRILIVEDDKEIVEVYREALKRAGFEVNCAYDGKEGLEILRANPFDLVVLDLKMPKMTGDKFLKILRADPNLKQTKVLVKSSYLYKYKHKKAPHKSGEWIEEAIPTRFGRRAKRFGQEEGVFKMEEKRRRHKLSGPYPELLFGYMAKVLVEEVKEILG